MDRLRYLLALSRPRFWLYLAGPVIVGVTFGAREPAMLFSTPAVVLFLYFLIPGNVLLYGINDVFDADIDVTNPKKDEGAREVRYQGDRTVLAAITLATFIGMAVTGYVATITVAAVPWLIGFFALAIAYSTPPIRFKTTPLLDSLSNGLYILPGIAAYVTLVGQQPPLAGIIGGLFWTMGMHTFSAIPDIEPDRQAGIDTTATWLGERRTYAYCAVVWLASAAAFATLSTRLGVAMLVYPLFVLSVAGTDIAVDRAYWWFPALNTLMGMAITMGGLWRLVHG
ncbi:MAG: prenyltransferase [Halobacteriales archaeon]|nr:prenyltransferase [Halobacteriales archaeon]